MDHSLRAPHSLAPPQAIPVYVSTVSGHAVAAVVHPHHAPAQHQPPPPPPPNLAPSIYEPQKADLVRLSTLLLEVTGNIDLRPFDAILLDSERMRELASQIQSRVAQQTLQNQRSAQTTAAAVAVAAPGPATAATQQQGQSPAADVAKAHKAIAKARRLQAQVDSLKAELEEAKKWKTESEALQKKNTELRREIDKLRRDHASIKLLTKQQDEEIKRCQRSNEQLQLQLRQELTSQCLRSHSERGKHERALRTYLRASIHTLSVLRRREGGGGRCSNCVNNISNRGQIQQPIEINYAENHHQSSEREKGNEGPHKSLPDEQFPDEQLPDEQLPDIQLPGEHLPDEPLAGERLPGEKTELPIDDEESALPTATEGMIIDEEDGGIIDEEAAKPSSSSAASEEPLQSQSPGIEPPGDVSVVAETTGPSIPKETAVELVIDPQSAASSLLFAQGSPPTPPMATAAESSYIASS